MNKENYKKLTLICLIIASIFLFIWIISFGIKFYNTINTYFPSDIVYILTLRDLFVDIFLYISIIFWIAWYITGRLYYSVE